MAPARTIERESKRTGQQFSRILRERASECIIYLTSSKRILCCIYNNNAHYVIKDPKYFVFQSPLLSSRVNYSSFSFAETPVSSRLTSSGGGPVEKSCKVFVEINRGSH